MFGRSKLGVILALTLAVVAALLVWNYTQRLQTEVRQAEQKAAEAAKVETVDVLVASRDIPARATLNREMLAVIKLPKEAKHPQALTKVEDADGKIVQFPVESGEQILPGKLLTERKDAGLAFVIPAGKRAVAVQFSELIGTGGLIAPGDTVDVYGIFDAKTMGKDMSTLILQNVEVLAVAQTYTGEPPPPPPQESAVDRAANVGAPAAKPKPQPTSTPVPAAKRPDAKTATMALSPEEVQRLILAEENGLLRLALRPKGDTTVFDIPEATLGAIRKPLELPVAQITGVEISPTNARAGDTLTVKITVQNTSNTVIKSQAPNSEFTYVQGQTFHSQNFASELGKFRVGVNFAGQSSAPFPYRWGFGGDLPPGASTTVVGFIKLTYDIKPTNFWAGLIQEPGTIIQDNIGTTLVTVVPSDVAVIAVDVANVRSGPDIASSVIGQLEYGTEVPILGQEKDWYKIKLPDGREGFVAAGWIVAPNRQGG